MQRGRETGGETTRHASVRYPRGTRLFINLTLGRTGKKHAFSPLIRKAVNPRERIKKGKRNTM